MIKVACYVDGFNLYHAIDDLAQPHLKWLDLAALAASLCRSSEVLTRTVYFSAIARWLPDKAARHQAYVASLQSAGVVCHMARFNTKTVRCRSCGAEWRSREEKETDVHFALTFLEDAFDDLFDRAIIVSADGDYVPAVRAVRRRFPDKEVFLAAPPRRLGRARELSGTCSGRIEVTKGRLEKCLLPKDVITADGRRIRRPDAYRPPGTAV